MSEVKIEICVDSIESALAAQEAGADRLEVCRNLIIGGTTPEREFVSEILRKVSLPVRVLLRPRFGDFCYSRHEVSILKDIICSYRGLDIEGFVLGALNPDGDLDIEVLTKLISEAGDKRLTLHRCFDVCRDPIHSMEQAIDLGFNTILTSGQAQSAKEGINLLAQLVKNSYGRIDIMAGGGITEENARIIAADSGVKYVHLSGKKRRNSPMIFRRDSVNMGLPGFSEYEIYETDPMIVSSVKDRLKTSHANSIPGFPVEV